MLGAVFSVPLLLKSAVDFASAIKDGSAAEVANQGLSTLGSAATAAKAVAAAVAKVPGLMNVAANAGVVAGAAAAAAVMAPIAAGLGCIAATASAVKFAREAHMLGAKLEKAETAKAECGQGNKVELEKNQPALKLMEKVCENVKTEKKNSILNCLRSFVIAIGCGLAAVVAVGILVGVAMTPAGWIAAGLLIVGLVVTIVMVAVKKHQEAKLQEKSGH